MRKFGRGVLACSGATLLVTLAACSSGSGQPAPKPTGSQQPSQGQSAVQINNPKDAGAMPLCDLLPPEAATSLGYMAQGEKREDMLKEDAPPVCEWDSPDSSGAGIALSVLPRRIADYYAHPETWSDFKKLTIAGHPAARANRADPMKSGNCDIYLGTQQNQVISSQVSLRTSEKGKKDPCQVAKKALEAVVPTLPAAK